MKIQTAKAMAAAIEAALGNGELGEDVLDQVRDVRSYDDAGFRYERGVVIRLANGAEFQITVVQSQQPYEREGIQCIECSEYEDDRDALISHLVREHNYCRADAIDALAY